MWLIKEAVTWRGFWLAVVVGGVLGYLAQRIAPEWHTGALAVLISPLVGGWLPRDAPYKKWGFLAEVLFSAAGCVLGAFAGWLAF
jgi:uncharacterized membrane protein YeaQ/YmgE (transglycosylase-associated protein family)